jgi:hypothetical protein
MAEQKPRIYFAAGLFNAPDTFFNAHLVAKLEKLGHKVDFPQRDGFEFGRLHNSLSKVLKPEQVPDAVQNIIALLDLGYFIPRNEVVLARMDEPLDPGVDIEVAVGHFLAKFNLAYRTDVRAPYGSMGDRFAGGHFFPLFMCDSFIHCPLPNRTPKESEEGLQKLTDAIEKEIDLRNNPEYRWRAPSRKCIVEYEELAYTLFNGIKDIHSGGGMKEISERYAKNKASLDKLITPKTIKV